MELFFYIFMAFGVLRCVQASKIKDYLNSACCFMGAIATCLFEIALNS